MVSWVVMLTQTDKLNTNLSGCYEPGGSGKPDHHPEGVRIVSATGRQIPISRCVKLPDLWLCFRFLLFQTHFNRFLTKHSSPHSGVLGMGVFVQKKYVQSYCFFVRNHVQCSQRVLARP